jgi:hypothetical protein
MECLHLELIRIDKEDSWLFYQCKNCHFETEVKETEFYKSMTEEERKQVHEPLDGN